MRKITFNGKGVDIKEIGGTTSEKGCSIVMSKAVIEEACKCGLLTKVKKTSANAFYDTGKGITIIICEKEGNVLHACVIDTYVKDKHICDILGKKNVKLNSKSKNRDEFRVSVKVCKNDKDIKSEYVNIAKIIKYYNDGFFNDIYEPIKNQGEELHHQAMLADSRLESTILFNSDKEHKSYHSRYGGSRHMIICSIQRINELIMMLDFLSGSQYIKFQESFKIR